MEKPNLKPKNPNFSSGPCSKRPGWTIDVLKDSPIGRSHRHKVCKERLNEAILREETSYINLQEEERKLVKDLQEKYGIGQLNLDSGTFTSVKSK